VRPRLHLGRLGFGFMVNGPDVVCLKMRISEQDLTWAALRSTGISKVFHIPSAPAAVGESDCRLGCVAREPVEQLHARAERRQPTFALAVSALADDIEQQ
jgi:hypothetical protein